MSLLSVKILEIKTSLETVNQDFGDQDVNQDFGDQDVKILEIKTAVEMKTSVLETPLIWHCAGFLILWPYTLGLTPSVHRGLLDDAIPIRDPSLTRHELFTNFG